MDARPPATAGTLDPQLEAQRQALLDWFAGLEGCAVAFSGGVDSAVVAQAAHAALGSRAIAITGVSASLASGELEAAAALARQIGIDHRIVDTREFADPRYLRNAPDRCYHCKTELYSLLTQWAPAHGYPVLLNGANCDDLGDYRPGLEAAREQGIRSPLVECGLHKAEVRRLAQAWGLPVWDKPASPCLSSRVAYGEEVTVERLTMIDRAEAFLRQLGFRVVRVRYHKGDVARIEVPVEEIARLCTPPLRDQLTTCLIGLGFKFVTLDLAGFRSGSLNSLVQLESATGVRTGPGSRS
ncbi:MAG: ATP-dependent sacrificial sulfur transferase LarE [Pirellulales bacterium]